jgi:hypothetical protein
MTDKDIIKALELCTNDELEVCDGCAFQKYKMGYDGGCLDYLLKSVFDLINLQRAEIEKLNVELVGMRGACNSYNMHYDNAKVEIERLKKGWKADVIETENIKAEAIKEFAKRLKEKAYLNDGVTGFQDVIVEVNDIDNLVKEMVGEK